MTLLYLVDGAVMALVVVALLVKEHLMPNFPVQVDPPPQTVTVERRPRA